MLITFTILGVITVAFLLLRKKDEGAEVTREELASDVGKFIDGSATPLDWDDFVTFALKDVDLEAIRQECLDVLLEPKTKEKSPWLTDEKVRTLNSIRGRLRPEPIKPPQTTTGSSAPSRV